MLRCGLALLAVLSLAGCEVQSARREPTAAATQSAFHKTELYFGTSKPDGTSVTAAEWQKFLDEEITPRFKDGLTVVDAYGQYLNAAGKLAKEGSKLVIFIHKPGTACDAYFEAIINAYKKQFQQESVLRVSVPAEVKF
jgi:hypothetical protein